MSSILQEIEAQIAGVKTSVARQNVGTVREISDGVAKIEGLTDAMLNEMLDFGSGVIGIALNLEETEVGAIILGEYHGADLGFFEVEGDADDAAAEVEHLIEHCVREALDFGDTVGNFADGADVLP